MFRAYCAVFLATFQTAVQYRVQMLLWLVGNIIRPVVFLAAWAAVARAQGNDVGGYSAADFAAYYVILTLVSQLTQSWNAYEFEQEVRLGRLSPKLLRPFHPIHYAIADNLVWKVFTLPFLLPVIAFVALTFHARFATDVVNVALFVPSILLAAGLRFTSGWVIAALAFWTTRVEAAASLFDRIGFLFAGQIAPLALLPGILQSIAYVLPFGYMLGVPADILRGGMSIDRMLVLLAGQAAWFAVSLIAFRLIWSAGLRQFSAVGA